MRTLLENIFFDILSPFSPQVLVSTEKISQHEIQYFIAVLDRPDLTQSRKDFTIKACRLFLRFEIRQETHNSSKNMTHFLISVFL